jgi:hypothetical protein
MGKRQDFWRLSIDRMLKDFVDEICNPKLQVHAGCCEKDGFDVVL